LQEEELQDGFAIQGGRMLPRRTAALLVQQLYTALPRETARPLRTPGDAHLEVLRLQLQAADTSVLPAGMTQGTWALNTGPNRAPAI